MIFPSFSIVFCALSSPGHALRTLLATRESPPTPAATLQPLPASLVQNPPPHPQTHQNALFGYASPLGLCFLLTNWSPRLLMAV